MKTSAFVQAQIAAGRWREETVPSGATGLARSIQVFRARRKSDLIVVKWHGDADTFCPPIWSDLAIGSGPCNLQCRACFLLLTFREMRDPRRHVLYDNLGDFDKAVRQWLRDPRARISKDLPSSVATIAQRRCTLGVGIDRSDSLLYEQITHHIRRLAPLFGDPQLNPLGHKLVLLTKTANVAPLGEIAPAHRTHVIVTLSLNSQQVADAWEGQWDDGSRLPPTIAERLLAARRAQEWGYEVRCRIDPILPIPNWHRHYAEFVAQVHAMGIQFSMWTLGTYREKNDQLATWARKWELPPMHWKPDGLVSEGTHWHLPATERINLYRAILTLIRDPFPNARVGLCKEVHAVRRVLLREGLAPVCNCLPT